MSVLAVLVALLALTPTPATGADEAETRAVTVVARPSDEPGAIVPVVDQLLDGDVLAITVSNGVAQADGIVRQCVQTAAGFADCTNRFPVRFGDDGGARFQYRVVDPGSCDGTTACVVVVGDTTGRRVAVVSTVFGGAAPPPPVVELTSPGPFEPGQPARITITSLQSGAPVSAAFCGASCGAPTTAVADAAGTATIEVRVGERCRVCGVVVVSGSRTTLVTVPFGPTPTADYDLTRLVAGLAVAAASLLAAWRTIVSVDWRPPSEAHVPDADGDGDVVRAA
ncbi:MAG: hypothetical protein ABW122_09035 [Ilumatobacteraceae bacterium]